MLNPLPVRNEIEELRRSNPELWEEGDDVLLNDMLQGSTSLNEFLTVLVDRMEDAGCMAGAIRTRVAELEIREARYVAKEKALRKLALSVMQQAGTKKVELPCATLSISRPRETVKINDETSVPDDLCRIKREPDKTKVREFLETHTTPNWAALVVGEPSLTVRVK